VPAEFLLPFGRKIDTFDAICAMPERFSEQKDEIWVWP
jgi:hypothetical protein